MKKHLLLLLYCMFILAARSGAQAVPDNTEGRLWRLCKVWGYMKYYSPRTCRIQWDSLLKATIPQVSNATTNAEFNSHLLAMLNYVEQIPPGPATTPWADTNLNLQLEWIDDTVFSAGVRQFLDTFKSRATHNDSIECRIRYNDNSDPGYISALDFRPDRIRTSVQFNQEADRLLVFFQYWNTFNYFAPYRNLADRNWDSVLLEAIPNCIATSNVQDFHFFLMMVHAHIDDAHGYFYSNYRSDSLYGNCPGIKIQRVENREVVTMVKDNVSGVAPGDVLKKVNGIPVEDLLAAYRKYIAASNDASFYIDAYTMLLSSRGSSQEYEFLDAQGQPYSKILEQDMYWSDWVGWLSPPAPVWDTLCNGYGYVDLGQLTVAQVPQMYNELKGLPAIVFDMRSYPKGTLWTLGQYFFARQKATALAFYPMIYEPGRFYTATDSLNLGTWNNPNPYPGRLFFLVDERTLSQAEYTVQYLSTASGARVVGSQTAAADGTIDVVGLPSTITTMFTGTGLYYIDGYQCQRNGLKIDDEVRPTIAGIRAGRDEVLESITGCQTTSAGKVNTSALSVGLYPNPATGPLTLRISTEKEEIFSIRICDILGKVVFSLEEKKVGKPGEQLAIGLDTWAPGVYLLQVRTASGGSITRKIVKQ